MLSSGLLTLTEDAIELLTSLTVVLGTSLILIAGLFFALINEEYRHTFFSGETGGQMTRRAYLEGNDVERYEMFTDNKNHWASIKPKVEAWVKAGWKNWELEKREWFTDEFRASVPEYMIPKKNEGGENRGDKNGAGGGEGSAVIHSTVVRQKSSVPALINAALGIEPVAAKIAPAENVKREEGIDVQEFKREMERQGSMNL
ncbi:hypothetical protein TrLO_g8594 [Triparma laevis f. longispina]|uniref:Uncharacterized protein n=1 Tax=Triparma laevis f. longispina TaxID=1714387 RepID=A0A9W7B1G1_9STRA|nr:hypothetical protein TrLO_g8594 [Triparma laevis f. longispina]